VLVTLGVTALRLVGELLHGAPWLFGRLPGGGLALVGISWLPPFVGAWLGARLHRAGLRSPSFERVVGLPILAALVFFGIGEGAERLGRAPTAPSLLLAYGAAALVALLVAVAAWPALARPLVVYALAVRLPVALVMLAAMFWRWGTHYDAPPPGFPEMDVLARWLLTGLLPQMTIWVAYTVALALPFSLLGPSIARRIRV
jgi:hypothetical protein